MNVVSSGGNLATLLDRWAFRVEAQTILERIVGRATAPACAALVAQGKAIVTVVDPDASGERVRAVYGVKADVRVAGNDDVVLPKSDLVVLHGGKPLDCLSTLASLGKLATMALIVVTENPDAWSARARVLLGRLRSANGANGAAHPANAADAALRSGWGRTSELAPVLWAIGRVRDHEFLDVPPLAAGSPSLVRFGPRLAGHHAFVVDVTPRSPQARRRLRLGT